MCEFWTCCRLLISKLKMSTQNFISTWIAQIARTIQQNRRPTFLQTPAMSPGGKCSSSIAHSQALRSPKMHAYLPAGTSNFVQHPLCGTSQSRTREIGAHLQHPCGGVDAVRDRGHTSNALKIPTQQTTHIKTSLAGHHVLVALALFNPSSDAG